MGFKEFISKLSFKSSLEREKEFVASSNQPSLFDNRSRYGDSLYKAYIPNFLYKPYFGYPLNINVISLQKLAKNPYVFSVKKTILDQVATAEYTLQQIEGVEVPEEVKQYKQAFLRWIDDPNVNEESFSHIRRMWGSDLLDLDAGVIVKSFNRMGQLRQIFARSGGSFLKNPDIYGTMTNKKAFILPTEKANFNVSYAPTDGMMQSYATQFKETAAYFQYSYTSNALPVPFGSREVIYSMLNPNTEVIYGVAPLQILKDTLYTLIYGTKYNLDYYTNRNTPNGILQLAGINPDEVDAIRDRMQDKFKMEDEYGESRTVNGQIPITDRDISYVNFGLKPAEMEILAQQQWFSKLVWAVYAANANEMGFTENSNKSTSENQTENMKRKVLEPILKSMSYYITTQIMNEEIMYITTQGKKIIIPPLNEYYKFKFDDYDIDKEIKKHMLLEQQIRMGIKTPQMVAEELGIDFKEVEKTKPEEPEQEDNNFPKKEEKSVQPQTVSQKEKQEFKPLNDFIKTRAKQLVEALQDGNANR